MSTFHTGDLALWRRRYVAVIAVHGDGVYGVRDLDGLEYLALGDDLHTVRVIGA